MVRLIPGPVATRPAVREALCFAAMGQQRSRRYPGILAPVPPVAGGPPEGRGCCGPIAPDVRGAVSATGDAQTGLGVHQRKAA